MARQRLTEKGRDYVVLDGVKGEGHYVGTYLALTTLERYWWGEGEFKFYIDDDEEYPRSAAPAPRTISEALGASPSRSMARPWSKTTAHRISDTRITLHTTS